MENEFAYQCLRDDNWLDLSGGSKLFVTQVSKFLLGLSDI